LKLEAQGLQWGDIAAWKKLWLKVGHTLDDDELDELIEFCVLEYPNTGEVALTAYLKDYNFTTTKRCIAQDRSCRC